MDKPVNWCVYCNRHEQLPVPEHLSSLRIHRKFVLTVLTLSFSVQIPSYDGLNLEFDHLVSESYRVEIKTWNESLNNTSCRLNVNRLLLQSVTRQLIFDSQWKAGYLCVIKIWFATILMQSIFLILFEAVIIIKNEHFLSILTMSLTIILPGTTNN
jgi:hypothetical protein